MPVYNPSAGGGTPAISVTDESSAAGIASAVGSSTNYARQDHTHGTQELALSFGTLSATFTIPAGSTAYSVDGLEIANGIGLEIGGGGAHELG